MNDLFNHEYLNNISDLVVLSKSNEFKGLLSKVTNETTIVRNHLIHKQDSLNNKEQFIFNLDLYISFLKEHIFINPQEIRYITELTIYNKYNKILFSNEYYYDNPLLYIRNFKKMFMYNYKNNVKKLSIKEKTFEELVNHINTHKKRSYIFFEKINKNNMTLFNTLYS